MLVCGAVCGTYLTVGIVLVNKSSCKTQSTLAEEHGDRERCLLFYLTFIRTTIIIVATAATIQRAIRWRCSAFIELPANCNGKKHKAQSQKAQNAKSKARRQNQTASACASYFILLIFVFFF